MDYPRVCPARWLTDQHLDMFTPPHDFIHPFYDTPSSYYRPWRCINRNISKEFSSTIENEKGNYKITLDVQHFRPNDISVKVTDSEIIVQGKHEERQDTHGYISRQFKRRYALPSHCPSETVTSSLSSDGVLTIIAERRSTNATEKIVPIKMCGTIPRKTPLESKMMSEITESSVRENIKESEVGSSSASKNYSKEDIKEEHSRLLKPELFKDTFTERYSETTALKEINDIITAAEKKEALNIGATSTSPSELKEAMNIGAKSMVVSEKTEAMSIGSTSASASMEKESMSIGATSASASMEKESMSIGATSASASEKKESMSIGATSASASEKKEAVKIGATSSKTEELIGKTSKIEESLGKSSKIDELLGKSSMGLSEFSEQLCQRASTSETCGMKMRIEESSSSFESMSSSMTSTMKAGGRIGETLSDIISAELREAAENS